MTTYIALLRGINVGGKTGVAMADLRALLTAMGFRDVRTYLRSGNAVFTGAEQDAAALSERIEKRVAAELGVSPRVLLRTRESLARTLAGNPYTGRQVDPTTLHVTFLAEEPEPERMTSLAVPAAEEAEFTLRGDQLYLCLPQGYGRTKLQNAYIEKQLGVAATTRNWRTVRALGELAAS